jgi:hypothetical protein
MFLVVRLVVSEIVGEGFENTLLTGGLYSDKNNPMIIRKIATAYKAKE